MPAPAVKAIASKVGISAAKAEEKWDKAKKAAQKKAKRSGTVWTIGGKETRYWATVMHIFKRMVGYKGESVVVNEEGDVIIITPGVNWET